MSEPNAACIKVTTGNRSAGYFALLSLTLAVILRTAWISDAATSTLHCAVNFTHGYGLTIRTNERVVDFVHPLWVLLISAATLLTGNVFTATFGLSVLFSLVAVWLLISYAASSFWPAMLAGASLALSKAYVDYSTSGLENPLSYILLISGLLLGFRSLSNDADERCASLTLIVLFALYLSRPDLLLLVLPFCIVVLWKSYKGPQQATGAILLAAAPIFLWTLFSRFYYGVLVPGIDVDALKSGFSQPDQVQHGIFYLVNSVSLDPITLAFILIGVLLALRQSVAERSLAAGTILYLACLIGAGGNSLSGYLLTPLVLVAAVILARSDLSMVGEIAIAAVFAVLGGMSAHATILSGKNYSAKDTNPHGIKDMRGLEFSQRSLINAGRDNFVPPQNWIPRP